MSSNLTVPTILSSTTSCWYSKGWTIPSFVVFHSIQPALTRHPSTANDVEGWLASKNLVSRPTLRARLSTLFRFAHRRGYVTVNPCERIEAVRLVRQPPTIFTVRQTAIALVWLRRRAPRTLGCSFKSVAENPFRVHSTFQGSTMEPKLRESRSSSHALLPKQRAVPNHSINSVLRESRNLSSVLCDYL